MLDLQTASICDFGSPGSGYGISRLECLRQLLLSRRSHCARIWHSDLPEVLRLEAVGAASHLDAVGAYEEVGEVGEKETAQDFEAVSYTHLTLPTKA